MIGLVALMLGSERDVRIPLQNVASVVALAYLIGTLPALVSGIYIALRSDFKGAIGNSEALSVSGLTGAIMTFAVILFSAQHPFSAANVKIVTLVAVVSAVSGVMCNRLSRRWQ